MSTTTTRAEVAAYVARVRQHLADLDPEVVEELTGGLEADLSDALDSASGRDGDTLPMATDGTPPAEHAVEPQAQFGDPAAYAAELRSSAGLPPARPVAPPQRVPLRDRTRASFRSVAEEASAPLRRQPWWPALRDFLVVLRPVWWVIRGLCLFAYPAVFFGFYGFPLLVLGALAVVLSVEVGRRSMAGTLTRGRTLVDVANVLAVLIFPFLLAASVFLGSSSSDDGLYYGDTGSTAPGIYDESGSPVANVFAYDAQGRPLTDVRLLDQSGQPITLDGAQSVTGSDGENLEPLAARDIYGGEDFGVFPLKGRTWDYAEGEDGSDPAERIVVATPPVAIIPPLAVEPGSTTAPTASATAAVVAVPNVVGQTFADARATLEKAGLVVELRPAEAGDKVVGQTPAGGVQVAPGAVVQIT